MIIPYEICASMGDPLGTAKVGLRTAKMLAQMIYTQFASPCASMFVSPQRVRGRYDIVRGGWFGSRSGGSEDLLIIENLAKVISRKPDAQTCDF